MMQAPPPPPPPYRMVLKHRRGYPNIRYDTTRVGTSHSPLFQAVAHVDGRYLGTGWGRSKGAAMEQAAHHAITQLGFPSSGHQYHNFYHPTMPNEDSNAGISEDIATADQIGPGGEDSDETDVDIGGAVTTDQTRLGEDSDEVDADISGAFATDQTEPGKDSGEVDANTDGSTLGPLGARGIGIDMRSATIIGRDIASHNSVDIINQVAGLSHNQHISLMRTFVGGSALNVAATLYRIFPSSPKTGSGQSLVKSSGSNLQLLQSSAALVHLMTALYPRLHRGRLPKLIILCLAMLLLMRHGLEPV